MTKDYQEQKRKALEFVGYKAYNKILDCFSEPTMLKPGADYEIIRVPDFDPANSLDYMQVLLEALNEVQREYYQRYLYEIIGELEFTPDKPKGDRVGIKIKSWEILTAPASLRWQAYLKLMEDSKDG